MAEIIRVAYRQLGGELDAPPLTPPWFLPGAEDVWQNIVQTERALRGAIRDVYGAKFGASAARKIEEALSEDERAKLTAALRSRPAGADALSIVDYLYVAQLPPLLLKPDVRQDARLRFGLPEDASQRFQAAIQHIAPVRNEIAHVREIDRNRLLRARVACADVLGMLKATP
jgi:hypothetical protein